MYVCLFTFCLETHLMIWFLPPLKYWRVKMRDCCTKSHLKFTSKLSNYIHRGLFQRMPDSCPGACVPRVRLKCDPGLCSTKMWPGRRVRGKAQTPLLASIPIVRISPTSMLDFFHVIYLISQIFSILFLYVYHRYFFQIINNISPGFSAQSVQGKSVANIWIVRTLAVS